VPAEAGCLWNRLRFPKLIQEDSSVQGRNSGLFLNPVQIPIHLLPQYFFLPGAGDSEMRKKDFYLKDYYTGSARACVA
jgi:hypothetical protein